VEVVDNRTEVREFLTTRRAKITPDQAGVPLYGLRRRVPGLRREEVAQLAGLSTDYYTRLEKGNLRGASDSVLDAIARAPSGRTCPTSPAPPAPAPRGSPAAAPSPRCGAASSTCSMR
jgi:transcriptional regulator with XRE-family HTH domain